MGAFVQLQACLGVYVLTDDLVTQSLREVAIWFSHLGAMEDCCGTYTQAGQH